MLSFIFILLFVGDGHKNPAPEHFEALASLVGRDWVALFPDGKTTDTQRFEWVYGGKFLRNTHWVKNAEGGVVYEGETFYAWDFKEKRLAWFYFNTTGGHLVGYLEEERGRLTVYGTNNAPGAQTPEVKGAIVILAHSYDSVTYFKKQDQWVEQMTVTYKPVTQK